MVRRSFAKPANSDVQEFLRTILDASSIRVKAVVILRKRVVGLSEARLERFVLRARRAVGLPGTVNILLTNSRELRGLNRRFRAEDKETDVLSFPPPLNAPLLARRTAGDVAVSADIALENAERLGHSAADEVKILVLHGILHLAGHDHESDHGEMARKEMKLRRALRLPVGLIERAQPRAPKNLTQKRRTGTALFRRQA